MAQRILTITAGRKKIRSKSWDFEALCLVDDNRDSGKGPIGMCLDSIYYLFEGTEATNDVIEKLNTNTLTELCNQIFLWYCEDILTIKNEKTDGANDGETLSKMRQIYNKMFEAWGILPDEIGRQKPYNIFNLIKQDSSTKVTIDNVPSDLQALYGR